MVFFTLTQELDDLGGYLGLRLAHRDAVQQRLYDVRPLTRLLMMPLLGQEGDEGFG
jgi:hypothetical protein